MEVREGRKAQLFDDEGNKVGAVLSLGAGACVEPDAELELGGWEVEVDAPLPPEQFASGRCFLGGGGPASVPAPALALGALGKPKLRPLRPLHPNLGARPTPVGETASAEPDCGSRAPPAEQSAPQEGAPAAWVPRLGRARPFASSCDGSARPPAGAVLLNEGRPGEHPVSLDQFLARKLRAHQVEGVRFLYGCLTGATDPRFSGALLADEMGLGKTLQVIALCWTLLRQGPQRRPLARKVVVVCPATLTRNWADEFRKWLGAERLRATVLAPAAAEARGQLQDFRVSPQLPVLIGSYEAVRKHAAALAGHCDLLVCDEGHRLKNAAGNKTIDALRGLRSPRTVLLTGTPVQNNLGELFSMVDFVLPGFLGSQAAFNRVFGAAIAKAQDRNATPEERDLGRAREEELTSRIAKFMLRRTKAVTRQYLPALTVFLVFVRPTAAQVGVYRDVLASKSVRSLLYSGADCAPADALGVLTALRKTCLHPGLLRPAAGDDPFGLLEPAAARGGTPDPSDAGLSGKLRALRSFLAALKASDDPTDKVVVCSTSTVALDLVQGLCDAVGGMPTCRIDGRTPVDKRQDIVSAFNTLQVSRVCLLSTQAGGAGLNLIGANRLVLLDPHWNPAVDLQAMARVWRDGQSKPCAVYRFLLTGTLDERVYMRQLQKGELAAVAAADEPGGGGADGGRAKRPGGGGAGGGKGKDKKRQFTAEELRDLFTLDTDSDCVTRDVLSGKKKAGGRGGRLSLGAGSPGRRVAPWEDASGTTGDGPVQAMVAGGDVTFVREVPDAEVAEEEEEQEQEEQEEEEEGEEEEEEEEGREGPAEGDGVAASVGSLGDSRKAGPRDGPARRRQVLEDSDSEDGGGGVGAATPGGVGGGAGGPAVDGADQLEISEGIEW